MKFVVPYIHEPGLQESRLVRLAEFLGIACELLPLAAAGDPAAFLKEALPPEATCLALHPDVVQEWLGEGTPSASLISFVQSRFQHLLVYGLCHSPYHEAFVAALSNGKLTSIQRLEKGGSAYEVSGHARHVCEAFSGLSFGPADPVNDVVFSTSADHQSLETLISIEGKPFMVSSRSGAATVWFHGSREVADLDREVGAAAPVATYFSGFVPFAMALRCAAGEQCWRPYKALASLIIDDPLLRENYGFLNFERLLALSKEHNFHSTIAFIPHNFGRNSARVTHMFRENPDRLSICYHGNDHTDAEFAATDRGVLEKMVATAKDRIHRHQRGSGLACNNVMVFPQGKFSAEAMSVLKWNNFHAAVNTVPHPLHSSVQLTLAEVAQPAVTRYQQFPLFLRKSSQQIRPEDVAFNLFFGRPVLVGEHHEIFKDPEPLVRLVSTMNSMAPQIEWCSIGSAVTRSFLVRKPCEDTCQILAYSGSVQISNEAQKARKFTVEWHAAVSKGDELEAIAVDEARCEAKLLQTNAPGVSIVVPPGTARACTLIYRNSAKPVKRFSWRWTARAFLRRRLSEFRDNYLSKNEAVLSTAKSLQRHFLRV